MSKEFDLHWNRGWEFYEAGEFAKAAAEWQEAIRLDPNDDRPYSNLINALSHAGDIEGALAAIPLCSASAGIYDCLGYCLMVQAKRSSDKAKLAEAGSAFRKALMLNPGNTYASQNLAAIQWHSKQGQEAIKTLKAATAVNPNDAAALLQLWKYQGGMRDISGRIRTIRAMNKLSASPEMQAHYAEMRLQWPHIRLILLVAAGLAGLIAVLIGVLVCNRRRD